MAAIAIIGAIVGLIAAVGTIVGMIAAVYKCIMWIRKHIRKGMWPCSKEQGFQLLIKFADC